jgi:flavorubredoxin
MESYNVPEICKDVYWVGVKDWSRRLFDSLIPLPQGTTYNAYLIKGKEKTALIDTVNPGFEGEFEGKLNIISSLEELDYVVMNHAEPDHAGAIPYILNRNKKALIVTTEKGARIASVQYRAPTERIKTVKDGITIDLGSKTLQFIEAPWLHWPETMFTYLKEDKILFPCDFLGEHTAFGFWDDEVEELIPFAQRYFGEIMMPFRLMGKRAIEKIRELEIEIIAPSHGPIHRNPERILDAYTKWTAGETKKKVIIVYVTMWNSTEAMVKTMVETLLSESIEVSLYNLSNADIGDIAKDLVDSKGIVLGTPTVLGGMHPVALYGAYLVRALRPPLKYGVVLSSYGWGGGAVKQASEILAPTKIEILGTARINGPPSTEDKRKIIDLGKLLAKKVKK